MQEWYMNALGAVDSMLCCASAAVEGGSQLYGPEYFVNDADEMEYRVDSTRRRLDEDQNSITYYDDEILPNRDDLRILGSYHTRTESSCTKESPRSMRHNDSGDGYVFMDGNPYKSAPIPVKKASRRAPRRDSSFHSCATETTASMSSSCYTPTRSVTSIGTAHTFDDSLVSSTATTAFMNNIAGGEVDQIMQYRKRVSPRNDKRNSCKSPILELDYELSRTNTDPAMVEKELMRHFETASSCAMASARCE